MNLTIRSVTISDKSSKLHRKKVDISIQNGTITKIGKVTSPVKGKEIDGKGMLLSPGWFDFNCLFGDPGYEQREDRVSGSQAAAAGGFTAVAHLPNTKPVIQTKNDLAYLMANNSSQVTDIHPIAAVTIGTKGEELTEMIDLHHAGAVAFSDGIEPVWNSDILLKTLQYLQKFDGLLINRPEDKMLTQFATMNEGVTSTILGMKGMPAISEELMITRDIELLKYAGGRIHFSNISTEGAVKLIRQAKKNGLNVSCDVAIHQMLLNDDLLVDFDTNLKVNPPLRTKKDSKALIKGVLDDTIDVITSSHKPHDEEGKKLEFDLAEFGQTGLQTTLPQMIALQESIPLDVLVDKITRMPREILKLDQPEIKEGNPANLALIDPKAKWTLDDQTNLSKSRNSYYFGQQLTGKIRATIKGNYQYISSN